MIELNDSHKLSENQETVSVIIPCFNQGQFLAECIISIRQSTYPNIEIIVVDDGSTDEESIKIFRSFSFENCQLIQQVNQGPSVARNKAIAYSKGKYILPLDADDKIGKDYIEQAVRILENQSTVGIVYCEAEFFGLKTGKWELPVFDKNKFLTQNLIFNCAMYRRSDFDRTGGYNPNMKRGWEDWDFWLSMIELELEVYKIPSVQFYYRIRTESRERSIEKTHVEALRKQIFINHIELYKDSFTDPISLYFEVELFKPYKESFEMIRNGLDYKLGRLILLPLRMLKKIVKK
jgi:glycosyltransferase involved in cell wall biosynthesis